MTMICMILLGFVLDIIVWKWRHLAPILLYYELAVILIMSFVPYDHGQTRNFFISFMISFTYILLSCESRV